MQSLGAIDKQIGTQLKGSFKQQLQGGARSNV